jgi:hypothetical protein
LTGTGKFSSANSGILPSALTLAARALLLENRQPVFFAWRIDAKRCGPLFERANFSLSASALNSRHRDPGGEIPLENEIDH